MCTALSRGPHISTLLADTFLSAFFSDRVTRRITHSALLISLEFPLSPWSRRPNNYHTWPIIPPRKGSRGPKEGYLCISSFCCCCYSRYVCNLWPTKSILTSYTQSPSVALATAAPRHALISAALYASQELFWHKEPSLKNTCRPWLLGHRAG